uniref:Uncharacterized protein n=1 Tax=Candidatus Kentrum sp. TC TaxID=2126339 RepID=A0A450YNL9_9GAMM|nr:MAG: hypothetical protein BECKTC1821E_GA0114239_102324 [Candidatus Kentron sp. TC]
MNKIGASRARGFEGAIITFLMGYLKKRIPEGLDSEREKENRRYDEQDHSAKRYRRSAP